MPRSDVTPKRSFFAAFCKERSLDRAAKKLGVSLGTLRRLRRGQVITRKKMQDVADKLGQPILDLIEPQTECQLPNDPAFFEEMRYGWFIDNDRRRSGTASWYTE